MSSSLKFRTALSQPNLPVDTYLDEPTHALLELEPIATQDNMSRPPLNVVFVVDSSATMHNFQFTSEERDYWMGIALSRDELERGQADERDAVYWKGQTLLEMQSNAPKPMGFAVEAIKNILMTLRPTDKVSVIAFADSVHTVFNERDWEMFPDGCLTQMDALREQRLPVDIGTGTRMAEALRTAGETLMRNRSEYGINRLIVLSDGIVQDPKGTLDNIIAIQEDGFAITTIGVGDEFDEEFLMKVADNSRGEYYYSGDTAEITARLDEELTSLQSTMLTDMYIAVRGLSGAFVQDIYMVRPNMTIFEEIYTEEEWTRARVGDVSSAAPIGILIQYVPTPETEGSRQVIEVLLTWSNPNSRSGMTKGNEKILISANFTTNPALLAQTDREVTNLVDRFSVYKYEREAQRAQERGDIDTAREKLGVATRQLHELGEEELAQDMEEQMASLGNAKVDPTRIKRIKATTRRLANPAAAPGATRPLSKPAEPGATRPLTRPADHGATRPLGRSAEEEPAFSLGVETDEAPRYLNSLDGEDESEAH